MDGYDPMQTMLPKGIGEIIPMRGGDGLNLPFGLSEEAFIKNNGIDQFLPTGSTKNAYYKTISENPEAYVKLQADILTKVARGGVLSSVEVIPDHVISTNHFDDIYYVRLLFEHLQTRKVTMDNYEIKVVGDNIVIRIETDSNKLVTDTSTAPTLPKEGAKGKEEKEGAKGVKGKGDTKAATIEEAAGKASSAP